MPVAVPECPSKSRSISSPRGFPPLHVLRFQASPFVYKLMPPISAWAFPRGAQ